MLRSGFVDIGLRAMLMKALPHIKPKDLSTELKRQALLFDHISIYNAGWNFELIKNGPLYPMVSSWLDELELEYEWLKNNGILIDLDRPRLSMAEADFDKRQSVRTRHIEETHNLIAQLAKNQNVSIDRLFANLVKGDAIKLREYILDFANSKEIAAVSSLEIKNYLYDDVPKSQESDVVEVLINKLPVPSPTTPWEKIIDYRNDPESRNKLASLRRWITKISSSSPQKHEIEEEFEWLIGEFHSHMQFHRMKTNTETIEVLLKAPLDLVTLKWSKLIDAFFAFQKRKIPLMEAELSAPGKEIAYILKAREDIPDEE